MTKLEQVSKKAPSGFSIARNTVITDGVFYNNINGVWEKYPVLVIRHGIRGTQNTAKDGEGEGSTAKDSTRNVSNLQTIDSARLDPNAQSLAVRFGFRPLDLKDIEKRVALSSILYSKDELRAYRQSLLDFVQRALQGEAIMEISRRMARQIANGRWLWRNRYEALDIDVEVRRKTDEEIDPLVGSFKALDIPLDHFDDYTEDELKLANAIASGFRGDDDIVFDIIAHVDFGVRGPIEVYPSQNYIPKDKDNGKQKDKYQLSRSLYKINVRNAGEESLEDLKVVGHAALRDQKIGNALRTFDTWYPEFNEFKIPIPVEPEGASLDQQRFFRAIKSKKSAFTLFQQFDQLDPETPDGLFALSCIIRGGVYSESEKDQKPKKDKGVEDETQGAL